MNKSLPEEKKSIQKILQKRFVFITCSFLFIFLYSLFLILILFLLLQPLLFNREVLPSLFSSLSLYKAFSPFNSQSRRENNKKSNK